jgi:hypothetical protein
MQPPEEPSEETSIRPPTNRGASTALYLGVVALVASVVIVGGLIGAIAIRLGNRAMRTIDESERRIPGRGMARAGVILGWLSIVTSFTAIVLWVVTPAAGSGKDRQQVMLMVNQMRQVVQACRLYAQDYNGHLPPHLAATLTGYGANPGMLRDPRIPARPMILPPGAVEGKTDWRTFADKVDQNCDFIYAGDGMRITDFENTSAIVLYAKRKSGDKWFVATVDGQVREAGDGEFRKMVEATNAARKKRGHAPLMAGAGN